MATEHFKTKLAAIFYADVAGYSRLTGQDEQGTHRVLSAYLNLMNTEIERHGGHVVHYAGDAVLAEFASVVDALSCAVEFQRTLDTRNANHADDEKVRFRIGINLGEVIVDRGDIYGNGVNIAARLESLADSGGICISQAVRDAAGTKLPLLYEDMGQQSVKNIAEPIRAYRVQVPVDAVMPAGSKPKSASPARKPVRRYALRAVSLVVLIAVAAAAFWAFYPRAPLSPSTATTALDAMPALPSGPAIAVLPFDNLSNDPEQDYFVHGISEDLITDLSKLRGLMVIARNSSFAYKGKTVDVRQIGKKLGVRYLVEGSVRKSGERLRVNAQLIDAVSGDHLWAERWDRPGSDIFAVQDELTRKIVATLDVKLSEGEQSRRWRRQTEDPVAYDLYLRGRTRKLEESRDGILAAIPLLEEAVNRDPDFAAPWVWLGWAYFAHVYMGWTDDRDAYQRKAIDAANKAIAADPDFGDPHALLAEMVFFFDNDIQRAGLEVEKAVELDPGNADNWGFLAVQRISELRPDEGYEAIQRALRLNPIPPAWYHNAHGQTLAALKRYGEAETAFDRCIEMAPEFVTCHRYLTATHLEAGNLEAARRTAKDVLRIIPDYSIAKHETWHKATSDPAEQKRRIELLKSAGLPE